MPGRTVTQTKPLLLKFQLLQRQMGLEGEQNLTLEKIHESVHLAHRLVTVGKPSSG